MHLTGMLPSNQFSADELAEIGRVTVESAYLEDILDSLLPELAKFDAEVWQEIVGFRMLGQKIDMFLTLAKARYRTAARRAAIEALAARMKACVDFRRVIVHGVWTRRGNALRYLMEPSSSQQGPAEAILGKKRRKASITDAARVAREFDACALELAKLWIPFLRKRRLKELRAGARRIKAPLQQ